MRAFIVTSALVLSAAVSVMSAGPFGLAKTPPMGWRSWNPYHANVNQSLMETVAEKMVERTRKIWSGEVMSIADLGFVGLGVDDNWQACGAGYMGSFHDENGNPLVNTDRFPDVKGLVTNLHDKNLTAGWYMNNCICNERGFTNETWISLVYKQSVKFLVDMEFDEVKLDGCSQFHNTTLWAELMVPYGRPMAIENCHNSIPSAPTDPHAVYPYNWYRSSGDIGNNWVRVYSNLQSVTHYEGDPPLSHPNVWAYPDMLEVGNLGSTPQATLQDRAHFGAWAVVSSPLVLGYDMLDESTTDRIWSIISNTEAIAVNQQWAGTPRLIKDFPGGSTNKTIGKYLVAVNCDSTDPSQNGFSYDSTTKQLKAPGSQCVSSSDTTQLQMVPCSTSDPSQQFTLEHATSTGYQAICAADGRCMDIWMGAGPPGGPAVQMYNFHDGANELFKINNGVVSDMGPEPLCFASRATVPGGGGANNFQIWAKPLPKGAVAVFVLANGINDPQPVSFTFQEVGLSAATASVRDVWNHKDLPDASGSFKTDNISGIDSRFFVFTPKSATTATA